MNGNIHQDNSAEWTYCFELFERYCESDRPCPRRRTWARRVAICWSWSLPLPRSNALMGLLGWKAAWLNGSFVICKQAMIMLRAGQHNFVWQVWLWTPTHLKQGRVHPASSCILMHFCCESVFRDLPQHGFSCFRCLACFNMAFPSVLFLSLHQPSDFGLPQGYWPVLFTWADFLVNSLPDPGKQLCTDDFEVIDLDDLDVTVKGMTLSLWKKTTGFSEDDNKLNIWEPEAAWADVEAEWRLFYSFCVLMTVSVCRGRIHTMWTWHLACTHFYVSAWWQGWVDQSWVYFLLLWARDDSLIGMFHMPRKNKESTRGIYFDTL